MPLFFFLNFIAASVFPFDCRLRFPLIRPFVRLVIWLNAWHPIARCYIHLDHHIPDLFFVTLARNSTKKIKTKFSLKYKQVGFRVFKLKKKFNYLTYNIPVRRSHLIKVTILLLTQFGSINSTCTVHVWPPWFLSTPSCCNLKKKSIKIKIQRECKALWGP